MARLTAAHPTRERLVELNTLALHRAGRTADALEVFARARAHLADPLGCRLPLGCLPRDIGDFTLHIQATALYEQLGLPRSPITPTLEE